MNKKYKTLLDLAKKVCEGVMNYYDSKDELEKQKIYMFLSKLGIETDTIDKLCESIIEIVGNSIEHGRSDCLIDIDVTEEKYKKRNDTEDSFYYGINVVVLDFSEVPFNKKIKTKLANTALLNERYIKVNEAKQNHSKYFNNDYTEDDFYTIASFQHKISGSIDKKILVVWD